MSFIHPVPKPVRSTPQSEWQDKAMQIAGQIARLEGKCAVCGKLGMIYSHHIIHRKYGNTCALVENLLPVCVVCHNKIHANETAFKAWLENRYSGRWDRLWQKAREICTLDFEEVYADLLTQYHNLLVERQKAENEQIPASRQD